MLKAKIYLWSMQQCTKDNREHWLLMEESAIIKSFITSDALRKQFYQAKPLTRTLKLGVFKNST